MEPYVPESLPLTNLDYRRLIQTVGRANAEFARYDGLLQGIGNPGLLLSPLTTQEAELSSAIEGTVATLAEVLEHEAGNTKSGEKGKDIQEIINYRKALAAAHEYLQDSPITLALIRQMHQVLMSSVRGADKDPGEFRKEQNWIGRSGCKIEEITHSQFIIRLLDTIFQRPIFSTANFIEQSGIPRPSALQLLRKLKDAGILQQIRAARGRVPEIFSFPALLDIVEN